MTSAEVKPSDTCLLLTRPAPAADRFADALVAEVGPFARIVVSPVLEIVPERVLPALPEGADVVFTSENGVAVARGLATPGRRAWCVGARTAAAAREAGFDAVEGGGDAAALTRAIAAARPASDVIHLSGAHQRGDLAEALAAAGIAARRVAIYDQMARPLSAEALGAVAGPRPVLLPLFSPRSAALVGGQIGEAGHAPLLLVHLSVAVRNGWSGPTPMAERVAQTPDATDLVRTIAGLFAALPDA